VGIDLLEDILNDESSGENKCNSILDAALAAGSDDDMTAIIICAKEE
jgi:serine/threonine protein phosphatase PrpC